MENLDQPHKPIKPASVDQYLQSGCGRCKFGGTPRCKVHAWAEELRLLRNILQASGLNEDIKWSMPCYTHNGKNILILSALKDSVILSFPRGAEMQDPDNILEQPGENSRSVRYLRFTDTSSIAARQRVIPGYIREAIELESSGKRPAASDDAPLEYPQELTQLFATHPGFAEAFSALTPGRQRGYLLHFSSAKQAKTRIARIEKCLPKIFSGKGWNEQ